MKLFAFTFLCLLGTTALSQNITSYTKADGLPSNNVYQIISVVNGELWLATENGVVQYDGYGFNTFTKADGLYSNENFEVFQNANKIYALGANGGLSEYLPSTKNFELAAEPLQGFLSEVIISPDRKILSSFGDGILIIDENSSQKYGEDEGLYDDFICFIWEWDEVVYTISKAGISKIDRGQVHNLYKFEERIHFARALLLPTEVIFDNGKSIWSINKNEELNPVEIDIPVSHKSVTKIQELDSLIYFSSYNGTDCYSYSEGKLIFRNSLISGKITTSICKDYHGALWVSTLKDGIQRINMPEIEQVSGHQSFGILVLGDSVLIGDQDFNLHVLYNGVHQVNQLENRREGVKIRRLKSIENELWIENDGALGRMKENSLEYYRTGEAVISEFNDSLLIGTGAGAFLLGKDQLYDISMAKKHNKLASEVGRLILKKEITFLTSNPSSVLIGTTEGLYELSTSLIKHSSIPNNKVLDMDVDGKLSTLTLEDIGTYYCNESDTILLYENSVKKGVAGCSKIVANTIYIGTGKGLYVYDKATLRQKRIHLLPNIDIKDIAFHEQFLIISSEEGVYNIKEDKVVELEYEIPLNIVSVSVNSVEQELADSYRLSFDENKIVIKANTINYMPVRARLYYTINGGEESNFDDDLILEELSPGNYDIKIYAKDEFLKSSEKQITILILPPWWRTWWFALAVVLIIALLFYWFFKVRILTYNRDIVRELLQVILARFKREKFILVKNVKDGSNTKIYLNRLQFAESSKNYVTLYSESGKVVIRSSLKDILNILNERSNDFVRCHKSYVINSNLVEAVHANFLKIQGKKIPIGSIYFENIQEKMKLLD